MADGGGEPGGVVQWRTDQERDLKGFHIVTIDKTGVRAQIDESLIACQARVTGSGADFGYSIPKHRSGHDLFVEAVYRDDHAERFTLIRQK